MSSSPGRPWPDAAADTIPPAGAVPLTLRLPPDVHAGLKGVAERTGRSLNTLIVEAVMFAMTPPGGAAQIAERRRKLTTRRGNAWAALAYLLGYLGRKADARKAWPWQGRFSVDEADPGSLAMAGALIAAEIDRWQEGEHDG
jgi:hypothetical protein